MEPVDRGNEGVSVLRSVLTSFQHFLAHFGLVPSRVAVYMNAATAGTQFPSKSDLFVFGLCVISLFLLC